MKIDVFSHILPKKYLETYSGKNKEVLESIEARTRPVTDLDVRRRLMDRYPEEHFRKFYNDTAVYGSTSALMCAYDFFGADRLLYGTDAPLGPRYGLTQETIASIERMSIPEEEKEKILTQNAVKLLSLAI